MLIKELPTPSVLIDLDRVERNAAVMAERAHRLGVRLRPHVKSHKCVEAARLQVADHFGGITVSTLAEARHFAQAGFRDITWALPVPVGRIPAAVDLGREIDCLNLLVDHPDTVAALAAEAHRVGVKVPVFLKVDCGYGRAGVAPGSEGAYRIAEAINNTPALDFRGLLTHGGHSYDCVDRAGIAEVAKQERDVAVQFAEELRARGIPVPEVSVGSTPTMCVVEDLSGVTEIRPGNYVVFDGFQAAIGSCSVDDVAVSVLTSVIGAYPHRQDLVVDAGALALSKDVGAIHAEPDCGFGKMFALDGRMPLHALKLIGLSQEHGKVRVNGTAGLHSIGARFRVQPNHSCLTLALHEEFHVVRGNEVVDTWIPCRGW